MKRVLMVTAGILVLLLATAAILLFTPVLDPDLRSRPNPASSYAEAAARIAAVLDEDAAADIIPEGKSIALLTGARTANALVIFHGYTNVPYPFRLIAQAYRDQGYNVWVPRMPYHGPANKMSDDFARLTAQGLREFVDKTLDIAAGLADRVLVMGISGGATLSLWAGLERPEVSRTILISPLLQPKGYPVWVTRALVRALPLLPFDIWQWWDETKKEKNVEGYKYPRRSLKGIAALMSFTVWAEAQANRQANPMRSSVLLIRNDFDPVLDSAYNESFLRRMVSPDQLTVYTIPASAQLTHDFVVPDPQSDNYPRISDAYRRMSEAFGIPLPDPRAAG